MEICHKLAIKIIAHFNIQTRPFIENDELNIKKELTKITKQLDSTIHKKYSTIDELEHDIPIISQQIKEFDVLLDLYLFNDFCKNRGKLFACYLQEYLCKNKSQNLIILYHYLTNLGLIMSGCIYIYKRDKKNKNNPVQYIDSKTFLQVLDNPMFQFSKSKVKDCINAKTIHDKINLNMARTLLISSLELRHSIKKYCPEYYKTLSKEAVSNHKFFEDEIQEIINILENVIRHF